VLQNDFAHPSAQDRFKIGRQCAMLIQKSIRPDSIVSNFYSTASPRRLLQQYLPQPDITTAGGTVELSYRHGPTRSPQTTGGTLCVHGLAELSLGRPGLQFKIPE
jgi:hypothetical protein